MFLVHIYSRFVVIDALCVLRRQQSNIIAEIPVFLQVSEPFRAVVDDVLQGDTRVVDDAGQVNGAGAAEPEDSSH